jgi:CBS domain-containing protein
MTHYQSAPLCKQSVGTLYSSHPFTVPENAGVGDVIALMQEKRVGAVLVEAGGRLKGVFSERDVVVRILAENLSLDTPVKEFLRPVPLHVAPSDQVGLAMELMAEHYLRHVAVTDDHLKILGIISVRNIIDCLAQQFPEAVINQPPRADQTMSAPEGG